MHLISENVRLGTINNSKYRILAFVAALRCGNLPQSQMRGIPPSSLCLLVPKRRGRAVALSRGDGLQLGLGFFVKKI